MVDTGIEWQAKYTLNKTSPDSGTLSCFIHITNNSSILFKNCDISLVEMVPCQPKGKKENKSVSSFFSNPSEKYYREPDIVIKEIEYSKIFERIELPTSNIYLSYFSKDIKVKKICVKIFKPTSNEQITLPYTKNDEAVAYSSGIVTSYYQILNYKENDLGYQIPKGEITIYDDEINTRRQIATLNTAERDSEMLILMPDSIDITVKRDRTNLEVNQKECAMNEDVRYTVKNETDEAYPIEIRQYIYRTSDWKLIAQDDHFADVKMFSNEIIFTVNSEPKSESIFQFSVEYHWEPEVEEKKSKKIFSVYFHKIKVF